MKKMRFIAAAVLMSGVVSLAASASALLELPTVKSYRTSANTRNEVLEMVIIQAKKQTNGNTGSILKAETEEQAEFKPSSAYFTGDVSQFSSILELFRS